MQELVDALNQYLPANRAGLTAGGHRLPPLTPHELTLGCLMPCPPDQHILPVVHAR